MKKIALSLSLLTCLFFATNCAEEVEFNSPAIQGNKDGVLWRADYYAADIDFGGFLIEGKRSYQTVQLITATDTRGTFALGNGSSSEAIFIDNDGTVYSTNNEPDPSLTLYPADGEIMVEEIDNSEPKRISGTFWFNAFSEDGMKTVNFNQGVFYRVSLQGGLVSGGSGCIEATEATTAAAAAYAATDTTDPNYTAVCTTYKEALLAQITACGDTGGVLQTIVDSLGDCTP